MGSFVFSIFLLILPYFSIRCISLLSDSSDSMSSEELFTVEKIRGRRRTPSGQIQFLVKWENYPETDNSWEHEDNCHQCIDKIEEFLEEQRQINKKASADELEITLPNSAATIELKKTRRSFQYQKRRRPLSTSHISRKF